MHRVSTAITQNARQPSGVLLFGTSFSCSLQCCIFGHMLDDSYEIKQDADLHTFEFVSEGPKGRITKVVVYAESGIKDLYFPGFGDKDERAGRLSDLAVTNNGDSQTVLATVARTLYLFIDIYPEAAVTAKGSTPARTRLY